MRSLIIAFFCCVLFLPVYRTSADDPVDNKIKRANTQIKELEDLIRGGKEDPQPKELQWNRYVTKNFEILSLDDAQGKYLSDNIEFMKTWILWRWGVKDIDLQAPCKIICVPSADLYKKLFNRNTPTWRADLVNNKVEAVIWLITDQPKWNTAIPNQLTEVVLANFEVMHGKLPIWCHRGMAVVNGRLSDIRVSVTFASKIDTKVLLEMTPEAYGRLSDSQKAVFDSHAATFCLWARQEHGAKTFLDYLTGSLTNPEHYLQYFGVTTYAACDAKVQAYQQKLLTGSDYYLTW